MPQPRIEIPKDKLAEFCQRHHIVRLSLFGSVLRDDFGPASDIDVLVEFDPKHIPGLMRLVGIEMELSKILGGRKVDMRTAEDISRYFRKKVLTEAQNQYVRP
jgi:predicted nucleotidyltransferase